MTRIAITGGPRTGKTTLAKRLSGSMFERGNRAGVCPSMLHTDDLIGKLEWSEASAEVAKWMDEPGPWIIEGVAVSRALRKWRDQHPGEPPPVDRVIYLDEPFVSLVKGQVSMRKGVRKVHDEIVDWLAQHGVATEHMDLTVARRRAMAEPQARSSDDG